MPLITGLTVENFRCFPKLSVKGLTRVNLIVGANNSGKTALLEALEWHASGGSPVRLWEGLERRGARIEIEGDEGERTYDAAELFYERKLDADSPEALGRFQVQLGLAHRPLEAEQQPVVEVRRVVDAVLV